WRSTVDLPDFATTTKLYLDIETYSDNEMVARAFLRDFKAGVDLSPHKPFIAFLTGLMEVNVESSIDTIATLKSLLKGEQAHPRFNREIYDFVLLNWEQIVNQIDDIDPKAALSGDKARIVLIGMMNEAGNHIIINCEEVGEAYGINYLFTILARKKPLFFCNFNGFDFDLKFIIKRCELLGISHPFRVDDRPTIFRTAKMFSEPVQYQAIKYGNWHDSDEVAIIDLFHQVLAWDSVNHKLTAFNLKEVPIQLGLRKEKRLVLSHKDMQDRVKSGDLSELIQYLIFDLEDTRMIGDLLLPDIYYQRRILPDWKYQSLSTGGAGSKWNHVLKTEYIKRGDSLPVADEKKNFKGGLIGCFPGLYRNVSKIDVASLYPTIMLLYQVAPSKDTHKTCLEVLYYLKKERLALKAIADEKKGTPEGKLAKQMQGALKILINSLYGLLGTQGLNFNDYEAAATVTAYG
ncbi:MAG: hypothetical protein ICV80_20655, partial [Microcoleus sp. T1-bin1]|nr:hypothetical protein [Microcoleus sp. T1-bin1]